MTTHREEGKKVNTNIYVNKQEGPSYKTLETIKINLAEQRRRMEWEQSRFFWQEVCGKGQILGFQDERRSI